MVPPNDAALKRMSARMGDKHEDAKQKYPEGERHKAIRPGMMYSQFAAPGRERTPHNDTRLKMRDRNL